MLRKLSLLLLPALILLTANAVQAQQYYLDTSFAYTGIDTFRGFIQSAIIHRPVVVKQQKDKKILIAGYSTNSSQMELMRLLPNGKFDSTFNDSGMVRIGQGNTYWHVTDAAIWDTDHVYVINGWLDVAGGGNTYILVYSVLPNGHLDPSFGNGGIAHINISSYSSPTTCAVQSDGKLVIMGSTVDLATGLTIYGLVRLKLNGTVDSTYGINGRRICPYPVMDTAAGFPASTRAATGYCAYMQSDNKYLVGGSFSDSLLVYQGEHAFIVRHNSDGSPDLTFGEQNGVTIIKGLNEWQIAIGIDADAAGNYYVLMSYEHPAAPFTDTNFAVIKLDHNGHRVMNYGVNGIAFMALHDIAIRYPNAIAAHKNGRVVIANTYRTYAPFTDWFAAYALDTTGALDNSFAPGGRITVQRAGSYHDICVNTAIQDDGKILLIGWDSVSATSTCIRLTTDHLLTESVRAAYAQSHPGYLFPNPSYNKGFYIHYPGSAKDRGCTIYAYDANGKLMDKRVVNIPAGISDIEYQLPPGAAPGIYTIVLQDDKGERQVYKAVSL